MQKGKLAVEVFTSNAIIPLRNARVFITSDNEQTLLAVLRTDIEGKAPAIEITAPDESISLSPSDQKAYTDVNVYVQIENYYNMLIRGVQIFAARTSILPVRMVPLPNDYVAGVNTEIIIITPQNL